MNWLWIKIHDHELIGRFLLLIWELNRSTTARIMYSGEKDDMY